MAQASSAVIPMNNLGNSALTTSAAVKQNSRPPTTSLRVGNLTTPVTSISTTGSSHTNAIIQSQGPNNLGQQSVQIQGQPSPPQLIAYQSAPPCGYTANVFCQQHALVSNTNPIVKCVKFLASWDCGPLGTFLAAVAFIIGIVVSCFTLKLATWPATKDYIKRFQTDEEAQRATVQCRKAAGQALPPPFFQYDRTNDTLVRRTLGGKLIRSTESNAYNSSHVWVYTLLDHAFCWLVLSAICYFACNLPSIRFSPTLSVRKSKLRHVSHKTTRGITSAFKNS
ncbi:hypothetical protein EAF00_003787 [Botryotinia globosa]|nr:hypothetical protein EAF00_003787 [Botryotinia globosa]